MLASGANVVLVVVILAVALTCHWLLRLTERRLPLRLSRWVFGRTVTRPDAGIARVVALIVLPLKALVWAAAMWFAAEMSIGLWVARDATVHAARNALTMPLFAMNDRSYSVGDLLLLPVVLALLWIGVGLYTRLVQARALQAIGVERGTAETLGILVRYAVTLVGGLVVLELWGLDVRTLAIVGSVLGVGIGFGLQNLANNFVSGLVIGLERPIKAGDFVRVGEFQGTVERIGPRSTEIVTNDRVSIVVPNSRFLEHEVINWTHGDPTSKFSVPVSVAYESHLGRVRTALLAVAGSHPDVLRDPAPKVDLVRFGSDGIELALGFWVRQPRRQDDIRSDLNYGIHAAFRREGIQVPFPQREVRVHEPVPADVAENDDELVAFSPHRFEDVELDALVLRMRGPDGVEIADRRHRFTTYPRCFVGRDAVEWLMREAQVSRDQAVRLGEELVERAVIRHVLDEHGFRDGPYFYRFTTDD